jgi:acyl carrier protein
VREGKAMTIAERVQKFIEENFYVSDPALLGSDTSLIEGGFVDSTGFLEVVTFLETEFGIHIDDLEMVPDNMETIGRISAFVARKGGGVPMSA